MKILTGLQRHQVLQRDSQDLATLYITGRTSAVGPVLVTVKGLRGFAKPRPAGKARAGRFSVSLPGLPTGGPYEITLQCGEARVTVPDVRVGDVWLLGGQSNMQGYGDLASGLRSSPGVFSLRMSGLWGPAEEPLHMLEESPDPVHTAETITPAEAAKRRLTARSGAGPALAFAAEMHRRTGVPQGLIACAHGGTSLNQWDPALKKEGGRSLYGSMFNAWQSTGQPIAGLLWYQGENETNEADAAKYTERFIRFVRALRRDLKQPRLPVLTVQLGRVIGNDGSARHWNHVQEQQRIMPEKLDQLGVVAAIDLSLSDNIHLSGAAHQRLGLRLAQVAHRLIHTRSKETPAPTIIGVRRLYDLPKDSLTNCYEVQYEVQLANVVGSLHGLVERSFCFVDAEHRVIDCIIFTESAGDRVRLRVWPNLIKPGMKLIYGHGTNPVALLRDDRDLAIPVTGPLPIKDEPLPGPGLVFWAGGPSVHPTKLNQLDADKVAALARKEPVRKGGESYWPDFINLHSHWVGHSGIACFVTEIESATAQKLHLGFGYDGPVRLWLDDREIYFDPNGTNPCVADHHLVPVKLPRGRHRIALAIDVNGGAAWGFALRWVQLSKDSVRDSHAWPICLLEA